VFAEAAMTRTLAGGVCAGALPSRRGMGLALDVARGPPMPELLGTGCFTDVSRDCAAATTAGVAAAKASIGSGGGSVLALAAGFSGTAAGTTSGAACPANKLLCADTGVSVCAAAAAACGATAALSAATACCTSSACLGGAAGLPGLLRTAAPASSGFRAWGLGARTRSGLPAGAGGNSGLRGGALLSPACIGEVDSPASLPVGQTDGCIST